MGVLKTDLLKKHIPDSLWPFARRIKVLLTALNYRVNTFSGSLLTEYYCPCCKTRITGFIDGGFGKRTSIFNPQRYENLKQDVLCPVCNALPRHRILAKWCEDNIERLRRKRILYFALEKSMNYWFWRHNIVVVSADLYKIADLKIDIENITQPDCSWDVVFCNHVLEHVKDYKKALMELYRILVPGGILICSFPIDKNYETVYEDFALVNDNSLMADQERICKFGQKDHLRVFGRDSVTLLENAGFIVTVIDGYTMPDEILPVAGPADYDSNKLFFCEKAFRN